MCSKKNNFLFLSNKFAKHLKPLVLLFAFIALIFQGGIGLNAQITLTNPNITPQQAVNDILLGAGVTAFNITYNGSPALAGNQQNAVRHFNNTSGIFPLNEGVLLQTSGAGMIADADLSAITTHTVFNGLVLEFDFIPDGDTLSFSYIFTSREYQSFTCFEYNDVFGFFISGPGITGPYTGGAQNIAIVPGSANVPVGINTVNNGTNSDSNGNCAAADPNWQANSVYYTTAYNSVYTSSPAISTNFNGSTVELTANASVICGETYHIKLAISNVGDQLYDSGVFLKAGSFASEPIVEVSSSNSTSLFLDSIVVEGCDVGSFCFERPSGTATDTIIAHYSVGGSANIGADYTFTNLPNTGDSIVLLPGESSFCLELLPVDDGVNEGVEDVTLTTFAVNACGDTTFNTGTLWIADRPQDLMPNAGADTVVCNGGTGTLNGTATTPFNDVQWTYTGPGTINFTPNTQDLNAELTFSTPGTYMLYLTESNDTCAMVAVDSMQILYGEVDIEVSNDTTVCENGEAILTAIASGGASYSYTWSHTADDGGVQSVLPTTETTYTVFAESPDGCFSPLDSITVSVLPPLNLVTSPSQTICPGESINIVATGSDGNGGPYNYVWTDPNGNVVSNQAVFEASPLVTTVYTMTLTDNCETTPVVSTSEVVVAPLPNVAFSVEDGALCTPAVFELVNDTDPTLVDEVYWYVSDGQIFTDLDSISVEINQAGLYDVQMVNITPDGCVDSTTVNGMLTAYPKPRADFTYFPNPVTILNTEVQFQNYTQGAIDYVWNFEEGDPVFSSMKDPTVNFPEGVIGSYEVDLFVTSEFDCRDTIRKIINVQPEVLIFAPNAFTPDGDEYNGVWKPVVSGIDLHSVTIEIFNRWGEQIWESHDLEYGWDGTYGLGGMKVAPGTYVWKIKAADLITDEVFEWNGHVNVIY